MPRTLAAALCLGVFAAPAPAADPTPAGLWKFRFADGERPVTFLLSLSEADGKWVGDFIGSSERLQQEPKFGDVRVTGSHLAFTLSFQGREFVTFDGRLTADGKKVSGTYSQFGSPLRLADLYPSKLKKVDDPFELARENFSQIDPGPELFNAGFAVVGQAAPKKLSVEDVRAAADRLAKAAGDYGPRWERAVAVRLATTLADQPGFADVALAQARRAERMLADDTPPAVALEVTDALARVLEKAGKPDDARKYRAAAGRLEARDYAEYAKGQLPFPADPFKGRKAKSDRAVLVELFTSSDAAPAAAADLTAAGLLRAYTPAEVVLLTYQLHAPLPNPLAAPDAMDRFGFYAEGGGIRGIPAALVDGKLGPPGGGPQVAKERYTAYRELIDAQLEKPAGAKLTLTAAAADKGYTVKAAAVVDAPGEKTVLRFAVIEPRVRYEGASGTRYHLHVVRGMPGGVKGFPLTKKSQDLTVSVDPAELRQKLAGYLDEFAKTEGDFPKPDRPLALTGLKLVAFVQNDATKEVLQAVQVDLDGK